MNESFGVTLSSAETVTQTAFEKFEDIEQSKLRYYQTLYQLFGLGAMPTTVAESSQKIGWVNGRDYSAFADEHAERKGDKAMAQKIITAAAADLEKKVRVLSLGGGTSYPVTGYTADFNSDWFSRRLQMTGLENLDVLTTDLIPDTTQNRVMTDFGFFHVPEDGPLFFSAFQTRRSFYAENISEEQETFATLLGAPPMSLLHEGDIPTFDPVDPDFLESLHDLYEVFGNEKSRYQSTMQFNPRPPIQACMKATGYDPRREGRSYIRPLVDKDMERLAFGLTAKGSVDALKLGEHFEESTFDFITMRHNGSYLQKKDLSFIQPYLKEGGEMLFAGNAYDGKWVFGEEE